MDGLPVKTPAGAGSAPSDAASYRPGGNGASRKFAIRMVGVDAMFAHVIPEVALIDPQEAGRLLAHPARAAQRLEDDLLLVTAEGVTQVQLAAGGLTRGERAGQRGPGTRVEPRGERSVAAEADGIKRRSGVQDERALEDVAQLA